MSLRKKRNKVPERTNFTQFTDDVDEIGATSKRCKVKLEAQDPVVLIQSHANTRNPARTNSTTTMCRSGSKSGRFWTNNGTEPSSKSHCHRLSQHVFARPSHPPRTERVAEDQAISPSRWRRLLGFATVIAIVTRLSTIAGREEWDSKDAIRSCEWHDSSVALLKTIKRAPTLRRDTHGERAADGREAPPTQ